MEYGIILPLRAYGIDDKGDTRGKKDTVYVLSKKSFRAKSTCYTHVSPLNESPTGNKFWESQLRDSVFGKNVLKLTRVN